MELEELLVNVGDHGRRVIVVENMHGASQYTTVAKADAELANITKDLFGRPIPTKIVTPEQFREAIEGEGVAIDTIKKSDIVLFSGYSPGGFPSLVDTLKSIDAMKRFQKEFPEGNCAFVLASGEREGVLEKTWKKILPMFGTDASIYENIVYGPAPFSYGTSCLVDVMASNASALRHRVGSLKDARFMDALSGQFSAGCNQTMMEKTFLCINDKLKGVKGRFDILTHADRVSGKDFSKYYAVFIDNGWDEDQPGKLGKGISSLLSVAQALENQGINIPLFYQTAHNLESITDDERARVLAFSNTHLISKNLAPKVSRSKKVAIKELEASRMLRQCPALAEYIVEAVPMGGKGFVKVGDQFLTFTKAAIAPSEENASQARVYEQTGIKHPTLLAHKMYVLANFHTHMKGELQNASFPLVGKLFKDFDEIYQATLRNYVLRDAGTRLSTLQSGYTKAREAYLSLPSETVIHNDAKWDNWFQGEVLGDFGSMCAGRPSKDIASVLLNPANEFAEVTSVRRAHQGIRTYHDLRKVIDPSWSQSLPELKKEVYGTLVTECLRQAYYKGQFNSKVTEGLINIAEKYATLI